MTETEWAITAGYALALVSTLGMLALGAKVEQLRAALRRHHRLCSDCKGNDAESMDP